MSMTYDDQIQYYANLLIIQYRNLPKAQATVQVLARDALIDNLPISVRDAFVNGLAVGKQLDVIGKYAGVSRNILTFTGGVVLGDLDFQTLINLAFARNSCQGSLKNIDDLLLAFLGNALVCFDHLNMTMGYFFNSSFGSLALAEAFVKLDLLPRPTGVQLSSLIYGGNLLNVFGWGSYTAAPFQVSGFQSYGVYDSTTNDKPWLNYGNVVSL